jgi:hypothetical protein
MKLLTFLLCVLIVNITFAKSWRVNNNPEIKADFLSLADAHISAHDGDTIYLEPSLKCYEGFSWNKRLVLIGTGYFLSDNLIDDNITQGAVVCGDITFAQGSEGSVMMGISMWNNTVNIKASYLQIKRNLIKNLAFPRQAGTRLNNLFITQNYLNSVYGGTYSGTDFFVDDLIFSNNIVVKEMYFYYNRFNDDCPCYSQALNGQITNNVFLGYFSLESCQIQNNIFYKIDLGINFLKHSYYNNLEDNIFAKVLPWSDTRNYKIPLGNIDNVNMTNLFVGGASPDAKWQIKSTSTLPLKDKCGVFEGLEPYVLSGIPPIPSIYYLSVPYAGNKKGGLNVTIKAKSNQ